MSKYLVICVSVINFRSIYLLVYTVVSFFVSLLACFFQAIMYFVLYIANKRDLFVKMV